MVHITVEVRGLDLAQAVPETITQHPNALVLGLHLLFGNPKGLSHAHYLVSGQRARAHAPLVTTAVDQRFQANTGLATHKQRSDAFGAIGLVRRKGHQVDFEAGEVDLDLARGLGAVDVKDNAFVTTDLANRGDVLNDTDLVVHQHDGD